MGRREVLARVGIDVIAAAIVIAAITAGLWKRRITWWCRWERATTLHLALQLCALLLIAPQTESLTGRALYAVTGRHHVDSCLGEIAYVGAAFALLYSTSCRVADRGLTALIFYRAQLVATVGVSTMIGAFIASDAPNDRFDPDLLRIHTDVWLTVFWVALCLTLIYLLGTTIYLLRAVRRDDPRMVGWVKRVNTLYIAGAGCGMAGCYVRIATAVITPLQTVFNGALVWALACAAGMLITVAAGKSWANKQQWFTQRPQPRHREEAT